MAKHLKRKQNQRYRKNYTAMRINGQQTAGSRDILAIFQAVIS